MSQAPSSVALRAPGSYAAGTLGPQAVAMAGQFAAGAGNFAFALAAGNLLEPGQFAALAAFLAVYLLIHVPSASVGAGVALDPHQAATRAVTLRTVAVVLAIATALTARPLASLFGLTVPLVLALAAALPAAALLGVRRGALYGSQRSHQVAASLAVEPAVRLGLGVPLLLVAGAPGGALAVVAGGWAGLYVASRPTDAGDTAPGTAPARRTGAGTTGAAAATFLAFALVANQDLLVANAVLEDTLAGGFAVLSVIGSAVAFATATIPMVLLPAATRPDGRSAARVALGVTAAIGLGAVLVAAVLPRTVIGVAFGDQHLHVSHLLAPYLLAMALLAMGRVLAARECAQGRGRLVVVVVASGLAIHLVLLLTLARHPSSVVASTLLATAATCAGLLAVPSVGRAERRISVAELGRLARRPDVAWVAVATTVAIALRLLLTRGLWVDEAISVAQAQLPLAQMLEELRWTDVHPPLHHLLLWVTVRIAGTSELAVRLPSIVAGAAIVPVLSLLGRDLYGRATGRVAAAAAAVAPFLVWYSQEARMYAVFMLAATLAVWGQVRVLRMPTFGAWALYTAATAAMLWSQYFAVLPIAVQQVAFVVALWHRRTDRERAHRLAAGWLVSLAALAMAVAPMAPIATDQIGQYLDRRGDAQALSVAPAGHGPVDTSSTQGELSVYGALANGIWALWGYHADDAMAQIAALWPLGMLAALLALGRGRSPDTSLLVALVAVPALVLFLAGTVKRDLFELRYFAGAVPLLVLLAARVATRISTSTAGRSALGVGLVASLTVGLVDQQLNGTNPRRYDFDGALRAVHATWEPDDVLLYEPTYLAEVVEYYGPDLTAGPIASASRRSVTEAPTVYVLATERVINERETSARVGDVLARLEHDGREIVDRIERPNVTVWELR